MMKRLVVSIGFLFLFIVAPTFAQDIPPYFTALDCPAEARLPAGFHCGTVTVLADRGKPDGATLRLMVAIYHSDVKGTQPDPLIYLSGGPGSPAVAGGREIMRVFNNFADRDIILFDQRGTGYSEPNMACPEIFDFLNTASASGLASAEIRTQSLDVLRACYDRLAAEGVDFSVINSAASAADIQDIRRALGYEQVNLYGISYGTRLALTTMRDYPDGIRSVILDSVYPPNINADSDGALITNEAFERVFAACAADAACNQKYPDLGTAFYQLVDDLNAHPVEINFRPGTMQLDGYDFMIAMYSWLYNAANIPDFPRLIYQLKDGNTTGLLPIARLALPRPGMNSAMNYSVNCREERPFSDPAGFESALSGLKPQLKALLQINDQGIAAACDFWGVPAADPVENQAVVSDIPTLVLSGEFDPITPPSLGQLAAKTLSHSYQIELPATGHGVLIGNLGTCAVVAAQAFLADPAQAPADTCPTSMPFQFN